MIALLIPLSKMGEGRVGVYIVGLVKGIWMEVPVAVGCFGMVVLVVAFDWGT